MEESRQGVLWVPRDDFSVPNRLGDSGKQTSKPNGVTRNSVANTHLCRLLIADASESENGHTSPAESAESRDNNKPSTKAAPVCHTRYNERNCGRLWRTASWNGSRDGPRKFSNARNTATPIAGPASQPIFASNPPARLPRRHRATEVQLNSRDRNVKTAALKTRAAPMHPPTVSAPNTRPEMTDNWNAPTDAAMNPIIRQAHRTPSFNMKYALIKRPKDNPGYTRYGSEKPNKYSSVIVSNPEERPASVRSRTERMRYADTLVSLGGSDNRCLDVINCWSGTPEFRPTT
jgi:hypothetical protein